MAVQPESKNKNCGGFTLVELMITIVVFAILVAVAAPSFYATIQENTLRTQASRFVSSLNLARSEAVEQNAVVTLCASSDATTETPSCTGSLKNGWLIFADADGDGDLDAGETVIRGFGGVPDTFIFKDGAFSSISYYADGSAGNASTVKINFCPTDRNLTRAWQVSVELVGRPSMARPQPGDCT